MSALWYEMGRVTTDPEVEEGYSLSDESHGDVLLSAKVGNRGREDGERTTCVRVG